MVVFSSLVIMLGSSELKPASAGDFDKRELDLAHRELELERRELEYLNVGGYELNDVCFCSLYQTPCSCPKLQLQFDIALDC